jgi:pimeloyl-ACP methyl ester carboxylesterase
VTTCTPIGRYFDVKDGRVYGHVREGDGPALVFLHYWGGSHRTWRPVIERLSPARAFVSYDHRGWGESTQVPGPYGIEQLADDAERVIDALGFGQYFGRVASPTGEQLMHRPLVTPPAARLGASTPAWTSSR